MIRVAIVEGESLMRAMLEQALSRQDGLIVVHSVPSAQQARLVITAATADVAILDVTLPDGTGVALGLELQRRDPQLDIMLLSSEDVMGTFTSVQDEVARPWSYLSKRSSFAADVLVRAVQASARGQVVVDPYLKQRSASRAEAGMAALTPAQFGVLRLVAEGLSNEAVAARLGIAERSVESHLKAIYQRLDLTGDGRNRRVSAVLVFLDHTGRTWRP